MTNTRDPKYIIAVDGYSSCGKSTFAKAIAKYMHYFFIDSGAMYRAFTLYCLRKKIINNNQILQEQIPGALNEVTVSFQYDAEKDRSLTLLNGENVEDAIRGPEVSSFVSQISSIKAVRQKMVEWQREIGEKKGVVMDGRDIGSKVFPEAEIKIFMTADVDVRAKRRYLELTQKGEKVDYSNIRQNIVDRDHLDETREESPLVRTGDAVVLDNSHMTPEEQMEWFRNLLKEREED